MGAKAAKIENGTPEAQCLKVLTQIDWDKKQWFWWFISCGAPDSLTRQAATMFFNKVFYGDGNSSQFVANMIMRYFSDECLLWQTIEDLHTKLAVGFTEPRPPNNYTSIVKLSDVYVNYSQNSERIAWCLDQLPVTENKQDGGLKEAFVATMEMLSALYLLDVSPWNKIKERTYVSFVKKTATVNTSVTSGFAASVLDAGETIGILNCGTGPRSFSFTKRTKLE